MKETFSIKNKYKLLRHVCDVLNIHNDMTTF